MLKCWNNGTILQRQETAAFGTTPPLALVEHSGLGRGFKTHWLVGSGATCHSVAEEWLKRLVGWGELVCGFVGFLVCWLVCLFVA